MTNHRCTAPEDIQGGLYGWAVDACWDAPDGSLWVDNGEYANTVKFCPWCGERAAAWLGQSAAAK